MKYVEIYVELTEKKSWNNKGFPFVSRIMLINVSMCSDSTLPSYQCL
jgi:hypothetical protein